MAYVVIQPFASHEVGDALTTTGWSHNSLVRLLRGGFIAYTPADQTADDVPFTPAGTIASETVQEALEEVASEAAATGTVETVAATGAAEDLAFATTTHPVIHDVTMDEDCTFTFSGATTGEVWTMTVILRGAFTPTFPASVDWDGGSAPAYGSPSVYEFVTVDGGTTVFGSLVGASFA